MDKYLQSKKILSQYNGNIKINLSFSELNEIMEKKIWKKPTYQVDLNADRINDISDTWKLKKYFYLIERPLLIGFVKVDSRKEYWLIDGQHRVTAALDLYNNNNDNHHLECAIIECNSKDEMYELFTLVNKDSIKAEIYINSDIFTLKLIGDLKNTMEEKYKKLYSDKTKKDGHIMSLDEFIKEVKDLGLFEGWKDDKIQSNDQFIKDLDKCNKMFWNDVKYSETIERVDRNEIYYSDELNILYVGEKNCMFLKNNNFREYFVSYIENDNVKPRHNYRNTRGQISKKLRTDVWKKQFKSKKLGQCPIYGCKSIIDQKKFECGHKISVKNGGDTILENLLPICHDCNQAMKSQNYDDYEKNLIYKKSKKCFCCKKAKEIDDMFRNKDKLYCCKCYDDGQSSESSDDA